MSKTFPRFPALITVSFMIGISVIGCSPGVTASPEATATVDPTATEVFIPATPRNAQETVILSYEEDGYAHLFAYIPGELSLTRLTSETSDDIAPAPSPDGKKIAFASNRSGFWDLYLLDMSSGEFTQLTDTPDYAPA